MDKNDTDIIQTIISLSRQIQEQVNRDIIKEKTPIVILEKYEWMREALSLLAKQSNLFESCVLLLENNMEQEAFILARSQFNNMLWISYLCNDYDGTRVKEYFYEPQISQLIQLNNIKKFLTDYPDDAEQSEVYSSVIDEIEPKISDISSILKAEGYNIDRLKSKSIFSLTDKDKLLAGLYLTFYNEASKFEHADISTVKNYRNKVLDDYSTDITFTFDLSRSDIHLWKEVFKNTLTFTFMSINALYKRIVNHDKNLFEANMFNEKDFVLIICSLKKALDLIDEIDD